MNTHGPRAIVAFTVLIVFLETIVLALPQKANELYQVKKIYIWNESETAGTPPRLEWVSDLKRELTRAGFVTVDDAASADAILNGENQEGIVLDGSQPDPPKYFYKYQLKFPNREIVWETKFNVRSRTSLADVNDRAAKRIAQDLLTSWLKSARRAGLSVGDRVQ